ncbi:MAG TPA: PH domain-containing protein [Jatrophihabitans sp.]|uniref:PH domain-containing protein n=1 Tax=Jatrophihabitans sp. TaxID=1932789 RepID=UPI002E07C4C5|nr:PH domain-containing protein [Jatrophihabitans sp.]
MIEVAPPLEDATWHRLSPRMLLVHPVVELLRALPALAGVVLAGSSNGHGSRWGLVAVGVVAVLSLSRWFTTRLRISDDQVQLRHGLLRRRTTATRRDRIRTVDVTAHPLHRVLGLARVVIGTGTSDRRGGGRIVLDGLTVDAARALHADLLHRASPAAEPTAGPVAGGAPEPAHEIARLDRRWIRYGPFTLSGVLTGLVLFGFLQRLQGESGVDVLHSGPWRTITRDIAGWPTPVVVGVVALALIAFVAISSTAGYVLAFWNFRLVRHDGGTLQVTRGLVTTRATSIERRRLVGAEISEPLVLRAVGGARSTVVATGLRVGRGAERGGEVLLPPAPKADAERVATAVLDGTPAITAELVRHGPRARTRRLIRAVASALLLLGLLVLGYLSGGSTVVIGVGAVLVVASVPLGTDRYRSLGHAAVDGYLVTRFGSLVRRRVVLDGDAVIGWNLRTSFFQRRAGLTTLTATTAAGRQGYSVVDVAPAEALAVAETLVPGLLSPFVRVPRPTPRATAG